MKKLQKQLLAVLTLIVICLSCAMPVGAAWQQTNQKKWCYYHTDGSLAVGWEWIGGKWYHFDSNGIMQTGWIWDSNAHVWYYCRSDGQMVYGWQKVDGKWYFLGAGGVMQTGWLWDQGKWYYLKPDGSMATGWLEDQNGSRYYLKADGQMAVGQLKIDGITYEFGTNGALIKDPGGTGLSWEERVLDLVNQARAAEGLSALAPSATLNDLAAVRAKECTENFAHIRPDESEWHTIFNASHGVSGKLGENLAKNYSSPEAVVAAWMSSPGHRQNILGADFNYMGIAAYWDDNGICYWAQLFAQKID